MPYSNMPEAMAPSTKYFMADSAAMPESRSNATMRIQRQRQQLDADVHGEQVVRRHQHEDAEQRGQRQHVVLAAHHAAALEILARVQQRDGDGQEGEQLEQHRERIGDVAFR